jgi:hypothetical protein
MLTYEGSGVLINIRACHNDPEEYQPIYIKAMLTVVSLFIGFSTLCYFTFGDNLKNNSDDFVTDILFQQGDANNMDVFKVFLLTFFMVNSVTSYPVQVLACF